MITNIISLLKKIFLFKSNDFLYKVQDIDTCVDRILLTHGNTGATLTVKLSEIYTDKQIIRNLAQHHCCWIGYYFGRVWKNNRTNYDSIDTTTERQTSHRLYIVSINRDNEIVYCDKKENKYIKENINILANSQAIIGFSQDDAFYIGFLCGARSDIPMKIKTSHKQAVLRVVK